MTRPAIRSMNDPAHPVRTCTGCGAALSGTVSCCWLCGQVQADATAAASPLAPPAAAALPPPPAAAGPWTFSLSSLMLMMTLIAVCFGLGGVNPGLGIGVAILVTPAALRTAVAATRRRREGRGMTIDEKIAAFAASLGVVVAIIVATGAAFYATCWAGFFGGAMLSEPFAKGYDGLFIGLWTGVILGGLVGLYVLYRMLRWLWPRRG
jgi:hypothetical protein